MDNVARFAIYRLNAAVDDAIRDRRIVGTVILLAEDVEVFFPPAAGLADRAVGTAMDLGTSVRDASIAGLFTSAASGGVYGHSWPTSPATDRSLVSLTHTALEGMTGRFAADIAQASAATA